MIICLGLMLPAGSSDFSRDAAGSRYSCPLLSLAPDGVYIAIPVAWMLVSSYLTFPPLLSESQLTSGKRYFSVALSLESPPLGITQHPALRSSDFPRLPLRQPRSFGLLTSYSLVREYYINTSYFTRSTGNIILNFPVIKNSAAVFAFYDSVSILNPFYNQGGQAHKTTIALIVR